MALISFKRHFETSTSLKPDPYRHTFAATKSQSAQINIGFTRIVTGHSRQSLPASAEDTKAPCEAKLLPSGQELPTEKEKALPFGRALVLMHPFSG
jgi:hypothetical protein